MHTPLKIALTLANHVLPPHATAMLGELSCTYI